MKVKFWVYMENLGDGSAAARIFSSKKAAEKYADHDDERYCDDIYQEEIEVDDKGKLTTPDPIHWKEEDE
jgi:hypothetical protein